MGRAAAGERRAVISGADLVASAEKALRAGEVVTLLAPSSPIAAVFTLRMDGKRIVLCDGLGSVVAVFDDVGAAVADGMARLDDIETHARGAMGLGLF